MAVVSASATPNAVWFGLVRWPVMLIVIAEPLAWWTADAMRCAAVAPGARTTKALDPADLAAERARARTNRWRGVPSARVLLTVAEYWPLASVPTSARRVLLAPLASQTCTVIPRAG